MSVTPQQETEVVTGIIQGVVTKNADTWQVEVNVGKQNPRRLWSKDAALVGQLATMIGQTQSFMCGVSYWTNQQNQQVRSLWINGVGQPQQQQPVAMPQPQPMAVQAPLPMQPPMQQQPMAPPMQPPMQQAPVATMSPPQSSYDQKEDRIHRQTATKVASILISHVPAEQRTLDNVLALSERLVAYYENGLAQAVMGDGGYSGDPGPQGIPQSDDDIPF